MKNRIALLSIVAIFIGSLVGCSQRIGDFTLISTKNVDIGGKYKKIDGRFSGDDSRGVFLGIPLGTPNLKTAVDNCIESGKGDLITNAVLDGSYWSVIIWGEQKYTVTGDVWVKASMSDLMNPSGQLFELQASPQGYELVSLSDPSQVVKVQFLVSR
jgi:hypothetical protein